MKKKIAALLSVILTAACFTGCSGEAPQDPPAKEEPVQTEAVQEKELLDSMIQDLEEQLNNPSEEVTAEAQTIEEKELLNRDGILIVLKGYTPQGQYGPEFSLYIENNTDKKVSIRTEDFSANDFSFYQYYAESIPAGKKSNSKLSVYNDNLNANNITELNKIEFKFEIADVTDPENGELLFTSDVISIEI